MLSLKGASVLKVSRGTPLTVDCEFVPDSPIRPMSTFKARSSLKNNSRLFHDLICFMTQDSSRTKYDLRSIEL